VAAAAAASSCKNSPRDARALRRYLEKCDVYVCPSNLHVALVAPELLPKGIQVAPQNCNFKGCGAYTGEMAVEQIKDMGMGTVLIGHSERRGEFGLPTPKETNALLATKLAYILEAGLTCVFCIGEALPIREKGIEAVIAECGVQLTDIIPILKALEDKSRVVIAYEPVWAIGTGVTASPEQAQETHKAIRGWIAGAVDQKTADEIRIQYGGSANAKNAPDLSAQPDIDGFLVGGASLKYGGSANAKNAPDLSARCPSPRPFPSPPSLLPTHSTALALVGDSGRGGS
jgi:triosephosphate isomerase